MNFEYIFYGYGYFNSCIFSPWQITLIHLNPNFQSRVKKKETDLLNSMDRANALEEELRNLGNKLSKTEDEHRRTQDQLRVSVDFSDFTPY